MARREPRCIVIAGPNGAGKTTFAREFLPKEAGVLHFVNADLIAAGLSPLDPSAAQVAAARILLRELDRLAAARADFAFETTMSGLTYLNRLKHWKADGYRIEVVFLKLGNVELALKRIALRVKQGGHDVPEADVRRRFIRGWRDFGVSYMPLADKWTVYDNTSDPIRLIERPMDGKSGTKEHQDFAAAVGGALRRAAKAARRTAKLHGTSVAVMKDGKVVLVKP